MTVLSDKWIKKVVSQKGMIKPFVDKQIRKGKIYCLVKMFSIYRKAQADH